jgi:hypothetical protein
MVVFKSSYKSMTFYDANGNLKRFDEGRFETEDPKEIEILKKSVNVMVEKVKSTGKAEAGKVEAGKVEAGKVEAGKVEAGKVEAGKAKNKFAGK